MVYLFCFFCWSLVVLEDKWRNTAAGWGCTLTYSRCHVFVHFKVYLTYYCVFVTVLNLLQICL